MVVAAGDQGRPRGRAERGRVELGVAQPRIRDPRGGGTSLSISGFSVFSPHSRRAALQAKPEYRQLCPINVLECVAARGGAPSP
jgi:hypothetical protein